MSSHEVHNWSKPRENEPQDEDANLDSHRALKLRESSLNQPVDAKAFELASLGLEYGDRLADEIERQLYIYDNQNFVAAAESKLDPALSEFPYPLGGEAGQAAEEGGDFLAQGVRKRKA